jgi:hypothetical protein
MKRTHLLIMVLACGLLAASLPASAQTAAPADSSSNWFTGKATLLLLGRDNVDSSKFEEYRVVPKGVSMPVFTLQGSEGGKDFALFGQNIAQADQRYSGYANVSWLGVTYDYNQIPHNMGNNGRTLYTETSPGVWSMSATLRKALGDAVDAVPTTARIYPFYADLLAPTIASANSIDVSGLRQRGNIEFDITKNLPFDLAFTYMREVKTGFRGASGGDILGTVTTSQDVGETMNEVTTDYGVRAAYNFKTGNVHATFNRNIYNDRVDSLILDNPFRATDLAYTSTSVPGGPAQTRFSTSPDNEASRGAFGVQLKFARQTRITGDFAFGTWTQDVAYLPYTINSAILTGTGAPANSLASLQAKSLGGKIDTTSVNLGFVSRPIQGLGIRLRYRTYDLSNKTSPIVWSGSTAGSPDRTWAPPPAGAGDFGFATADPYSNKTKRFDAQVSYDIKDLTLEGSLRASKLDRTYREATSGDENAYAFAAVYHSSGWLAFRGVFDSAKRTAKGWDPATTVGLGSDEAEKKSTRGGVNIELTPSDKFGVTFAYFRRNDDYPNRPARVVGNADTTVGLLNAKYDTYSVDFDYTPSERAEISAFYTYEKNANLNRTVTLTGTAVNNQLGFNVSDKANTFGANAVIHLVPEKWTFSFMLSHQKVDGLFDVSANPTGSFYLGRTTLNPPGPQDITDYDDTQLSTVMADLAYNVSKAWTFSVGYAYEKYTHADAFSDGTTIFPQSVLFFLKANDGAYNVNVAYAKLNYRF